MAEPQAPVVAASEPVTSPLPPSPFMRIFCGCHPVVNAADQRFLPSAAVFGQLPASNSANANSAATPHPDAAKGFMEVVRKQPCRPRSPPIDTTTSTTPFINDSTVTPLQRAILAAIGHAITEDAGRPLAGAAAGAAADTAKNDASPSCEGRRENVLSPEHLATELAEALSRRGFVRLKRVVALFEALKRRGRCGSAQAKFLIGLFGSRMSLDRAGAKMDALEEVWKALPKLGVVYTVDHYNAALRALIESEESFSPIQVLLEMESECNGSKNSRGGGGVQPNRVTFELFIALFCQEGRVEAVAPILNHMQSKGILFCENILHSLVYGHLKMGDETTASRLLGLLRQSRIPVTVSTVEAVLCGLAERGDVLRMMMTIRAARRASPRDPLDLRTIVTEKRDAGAVDDGGVILASSPTALTPPNVAPFNFEAEEALPLVDNQALLSAILALVKCGHGEHLKVILNQIVVSRGTPVVFLHQLRNALFHLVVEGYRREAFSLFSHFAVKAYVEEEAELRPEDAAAAAVFLSTRDDLVRSFFAAVLESPPSLEEFLRLFSSHLFEVDARVAVLILNSNIDLISSRYSESELIFLS